MASEVVCGLVFRLLLPVCLAVACAFRYNGLSFVYLIYLLLIPLFSEPTKVTMQGHTGRLLKSLCFTSLSFLLLHIIFHITLASLEAQHRIAPGYNCSTWEKTFRQIGFESLKGADAGNGIRVFVPDIGMFIASLTIWLVCRNIVQKPVTEEAAQYNPEFENEELVEGEKLDPEEALIYEEDLEEGDGVDGELEESTKLKIFRRLASVASKLKEFIGNMITTAGKVVVTILLGSSGMMLPSLTSSVYFFVFLGLCTWWSWCRTFDPLLFSCLCVLLAIFTAGHLIGLYLYQFQFFQEAVPPNDYYARLFGIKSVIRTDCSSTWKIIANPDLSWYHHANPILLLVMYYTLATLIRIWLQEPLVQDERTKEEERALACSPIPITAERRRSLWYATHYPTDERKLLSMTQDDYKPSDGLLVTVNGNPVDYHTIHPSLPLENGPAKADLYSTPQYRWEPSDDASEKKEEEEDDKDEFEKERSLDEKRSVKVHAMVSVFQFIMKQSYICALIAMMAWSITYHSWLTFVLLIWSCTLWMIRNRRKYAMISSPFMVAYGNLLLILQYIWSFELPEIKKVPGFLEKKDPGELASKILFTITFWLLLRQHLTEQKALQEKEALLSEVKIGSQENEEKDDEQDTQVEGEAEEKEEEEATKEEKQERKKEEEEEEEVDEDDDQDIMKVLGNLVVAMFIKYWIYVCGGMFFFVSFEGKIVMYKIIYMVLFLFCVALYQVHYEWWRRILKYFWMSVVIYTMLVLIFIYTYQFENFPGLWQNMTGLKKEKLEDLGLKQFTVAELFTRIFIPTSFLLVCILHLHYFHDRFLELTDLKSIPRKEDSAIYSHAKVNGRVYLIINRLAHPEGSLPDLAMINLTTSLEKLEEKRLAEPAEEKPEGCSEETEKEELEKDSEEEEGDEEEEEEEEEDEPSDLRNKWHLVIDRLTVLFLKFLEYFHKLQVFMWWILELHIIKIVSSYIIWVSVKEVSLFNYVFLISWAFALPYAKLRRLASSVCTVWTCVIIVCKMLYQLQTIKPENFSVNCPQPSENQTNIPLHQVNMSLLYSGPIDPTEWVGLRKSSPLLVYLRNNLLMLAILAFEVTIYRHQEYYRGRNNLTAPVSKTIFHDITRLHLDDGIINCAKYFINYFFYKFGLETCFLMSINVIGQRMDFYAMIHACWLIAVLYRRRRKAIAEVWPKYCCFLACIITFQYFVCIGIPPAPCKDYPWRFKSASFNDNIIKWLYFPDFIVRPNPVFLVYDFLLLLCASLQRQIFEDENKAAVRIMAGDNVEICMNLDAASFSQHNPVPDFIHCRSYLDMSKVVIFSYLFWFVLTIIFITGTTRISIFCMGYLVACFYFLLFGGDLLLKPIRSILRYWDWLIAYNVFVITMKNILSIGACGYIEQLVQNSCWFIQAFSLACTVKGYKLPNTDGSCKLPSGEAGIIWDSICFAFLLLQRRVFMSYYFLHVVADIKASQILASRGAELFQATIVKAVKARIEEEKKSMDQLKRQMDRIKARQQKYKKGKERMLSLTQESGEAQDLQQLSEEDDEREAEKQKAKGKKKQWWRPWVDHASMVRSGDYYLFETDSEEEEEEELRKEDEEPPRKSAFQFVYQAWITDPKTALRQRRKEKKRSAREEQKRLRKASGEGPVDWEDREDEPIKKKSDGPDNIIKRIFNILKFTWVLFLATVDSFTTWLNSISREHIDISTVLRIERCMLTREIKKGNVPTRESIHMYYQNHIMNLSRESGLDAIDDHGNAASSAQPAHRMDSLDSHDSISRMFHDDELEESEKFYVGQPRFLLLFYAMYNTLVARSEMVCYFVIILNHMVSASMITLVLPILIFLWAMLSVPRPSRRFWMMAIIYTEVAIVVKYFFQFGFFPWNKNVELNKDKPYHPPNIIGVEKKEGYVLYDLIQLLALFFHRSILKCHGLWDEDDIADTGTDKEDSDDELSLSRSRRASSDSLKSINLAASAESVHVSFPEQPTAVRRKHSGSSSPNSPRSSFSSNRSKRGSTSTRNSSQKGSSVSSIRQKTKRQLYMEKFHEHLIKAKAITLKKTNQIYVPIKQFFYNLIHPDYSAVTDVYVLMFLADTVDFIIIVFGFWAFGKHSAAADITSSLSEDQVPGPFLVMVLIQFGTMVVDRALYLRKTVLGKVIFQVILVFGIHFWMFFILPGVTERKFSQNLVAQLWYFVKCVYFGLSAYQIRCGYPTRVLGNFLTKSYNYVNLFLFQGFRLVPFLTELRAVMDWVWTDTTLSLSSWICVEDIYAHIFILKCWRESEKRYPQPRGQKKKKVVKYGMGGMIIVLLICIVWFPLLFMSLIKSVAGVINQPLDVSVTITLGGYQPIFTMSAQQSQLKVMDQLKFDKFMKTFSRDTGAMQFLENYEKEDITVAELEGNSNSLWTISPPSKQKMMQELLDPNSSFSVVFSWSIQRNMSLGAKAEIATDKLSFVLANNTRENIAKMIAGNDSESSKTPVTIERIYPYYVKAPSDSNSKPIKQLLSENDFMNITIILSRDNATKSNSEWWVLNLTGNRLYNQHSQALELVVFNDKVSPPSLGFLAGYGIMGLYASVVLVIGKFVREFFSGISHSIMFEELPNVDRILKLCTDIFLVRETGELELEEDLYAKLIFLYRSPETMIKWTREKTN
ncbi:piezo-type mechanosensitive ion channel component 2 isoform X4 [Talpa occidentalis]|uniref:piezo-type mechanosensitive ion channel component 2 isoform X4 n=1 Tax=Talpa occidentalis TaxID=50954 RepID=UPI0023F90ACE|nr:piezo-type mechanosensitive ion channel component 2 isoform X4 [Talpa occidentalis]